MVPDWQESPPHSRKASLTGLGNQIHQCAQRRTAPASNQRQLRHQNRGTTPHSQRSSERNLTLLLSGFPGLELCLSAEEEPRASLITDEFREVVGVWKWGVRREWREAKCCRVERFSSNLRPCLRTLIQRGNRCQGSSSNRYYLCGHFFRQSSLLSGHLNHLENARFRWKEDAAKAHFDRILTASSCSWMMPACWTGIYCLLTLVHVCSGRMKIE